MWIKTTDNLPDKLVKCLVVSHGNVLDYPYYLNELNRWVNIPYINEISLCNVSHWMLYPTLPKSEKVHNMKEKFCVLTRKSECPLRSDFGRCIVSITSLPEYKHLTKYKHIDCRHSVDAHPVVDEEMQK